MLSISRDIVLGSKSPRRREILQMAGITFRIHDIDYEEKIPDVVEDPYELPAYLAEQKALHATGLDENDILITADTLVFLKDKVIGKPHDRDDAFEKLQSLSGRMHEVITGVCILLGDEKVCFSDRSKVFFKELEAEELEYYIDNFPVMDKAGAYGVQDWMGLVGIERIEGSYFNVMGLPIHRVYHELKRFENRY